MCGKTEITYNLIRLLFRFWTALLGPEHAPNHSLQAVEEYLHALLAAPLGHQLQVSGVVAVVEERLLPTVAPLGNMMGIMGGCNTGYSWHNVRFYSENRLKSNKNMGSVPN